MQLIRCSGTASAPTEPLLSIVVCAYNHAAFIDECLGSINAANSQDTELIVIDDGSPDETLRRCMDYPFDPDFSVRICAKPNQGLVHSLLTGLGLARGRYVAFIGSDDSYAQEGLDRARADLRRAELPVDALLCQADFVGHLDGPVYGPVLQALFSRTAEERLIAICTEFPKPMLLQATIFRTEFLRSLNPWSDGLELDDWPTFIRVFTAAVEQGAVVRYVPGLSLCRYRIHAGGISKQLQRQLRVTEQVAKSLVPARYRNLCLANLRVDIGLSYLRERQWIIGAAICVHGLVTCPRWKVIRRLLASARNFAERALRAPSNASPTN